MFQVLALVLVLVAAAEMEDAGSLAVSSRLPFLGLDLILLSEMDQGVLTQMS